MDRKIALIVNLFSSIFIYGQDLTINGIHLKNEIVKHYDIPTDSTSTISLKMTYGNAIITNVDEINKLTGGQIVSIDIVFSDFPKGSSFLQLTTKRIESLRRTNPQIFSDKIINWCLIRQTDCKDQEAAEKLFHGIVITFISPQRIKIKQEIKEINESLKKQRESKKKY